MIRGLIGSANKLILELIQCNVDVVVVYVCGIVLLESASRTDPRSALLPAQCRDSFEVLANNTCVLKIWPVTNPVGTLASSHFSAWIDERNIAASGETDNWLICVSLRGLEMLHTPKLSTKCVAPAHDAEDCQQAQQRNKSDAALQ